MLDVVAVPGTSVQVGEPVMRNWPDHEVVRPIVTASAGCAYVWWTVWSGYGAPGSVVTSGARAGESGLMDRHFSK